MGGTVLPTASTPGYARSPWGPVGCVCLIEWLEAAEQLGLALGLIRESLDVVQLTGDADASAGVHSLGAAFDVRQRSSSWVRIFREMGAAFWPREGPDWAGNEHGHGVIRCKHDSRCAYQHTAWRRGYDGLGRGWILGQLLWGYGHPDPEWRPATIRTTAQGIAWARTETERINNVMPALSDTEQETVLAAAQRTLGRDPQRYMAYDSKAKRWRAVDKADAGARPSPSLDSLDGQAIREDLDRFQADIERQLSAVLQQLAEVRAAIVTPEAKA